MLNMSDITQETKEKGTFYAIVLYCHIKYDEAHKLKHDYALGLLIMARVYSLHLKPLTLYSKL